MKEARPFIACAVLVLLVLGLQLNTWSASYGSIEEFRGANLKEDIFYPLIAKSINDRFGDRVNAFQNVIEVDLAPKGCSKGLAISEIRKYYGDCRIYGIGDSINDLPLIEAADVSYTFPYAPPEVQEKATKIVDTIVEALEDSMQDPIDE